MRYSRLVAFLFTMITVLGLSGNPLVKQWNTDEIGARSFYAINQDKNGFVWIGTDYGLTRFDGTRFKTYRHIDEDSTSINENTVKRVVISKDGTMWVGTADGLHRYQPETDNFSLIKLPGVDSHGYINDAAVDKDGNLYFIASAIGIFKVSPESNTAKHLLENTLPRQQRFSRIAVDSVGNIWVAQNTPECIIKVSKKGNKVSRYNNLRGQILNIIANPSQPLTVVTTTGIYYYNKRDNRFDIIYLNDSFPQHLSFGGEALCGNNHNIIASSHGLLRLDKNNVNTNLLWDKSSFLNRLGHDFRESTIMGDLDSNLWIGVNGKGIFMISGREAPFNYFDFEMLGKSENAKIAIAPDRDDSFWINLPENKLTLVDYSGKVNRQINLGYETSNFYDNGNGTLYIWKNRTGLVAYDIQSEHESTVVSLAQEADANFITGSPDSSLIFVAVNGFGLLQYDASDKAYHWYNSENSDIANNWTSALAFSPDRKKLWIGHFGGLSCLNINTGEISEVSNSWFRKIACHSISVGNSGDLWIGANRGLINFNPQTDEIHRYTTGNGLSDNIVCAVTQDDSGIIWCSTKNGINSLDPVTGKIAGYYGGNGLRDKIYAQGKGFKSDSGKIYFLGAHGVLNFNSADTKDGTFNGDVAISDIQVNGRYVNMSTVSGGRKALSSLPVQASDIHLAYRDNNISLFLTTTKFHDGGNVHYEYRMDDNAGQWYILPAGENVIRLHNLDHGRHRLSIRAVENGMSSKVKDFDIIIASPWYLSWTAFSIYILLGLVAGLLIYQYLKRKRREEINESMLKYFVNVSHEIRSPVSLIISPLESLMQSATGKREKELLKTMHLNALRVMSLINQLLDVRKIDKGKMTLHYSRVNLVDYAAAVSDIFRFEAKKRHITLTVSSAAETIFAWIDTDNMDKVLINLISNAFKYTPDNGQITIDISSGIDEATYGPLHKYIRIDVSDTGSGLKDKDISRVFDRFYQSDNPSVKIKGKGFGIGLNLCKMLIEMHSGKIMVSNRPDCNGCTFTILLPAGRKHIADSEIISTPHTTDTIEENASSFLILDDEETSKIAARRPRSSCRILVVDDSDEVVDYLKKQLSAGYNVFTASNGKKALELATAELPDLIITDVVMPELDGIELLKRLKSNVTTNHIPIVLLTARGEIVDRLKGLDYGADAYIAKPFVLSELEVVVNNLIENRQRLKGKYSGTQEQTDRVRPVEIPGNDETLMERIMAIINENIDNQNLNVEMLCAELGISRVHLHRRMKSFVGMSPGEFIRNIRLKQACELLKNKDIDITQIAYAVGFTNNSHFSTTFKKYYGVPPTEFRNNN